MTPKMLHPKKVICQKRLQDSSIEENKLQFVTLFLPLTFLNANVSHFPQSFENHYKFCVVLIPTYGIFKFCEEKVFRSY